MKAYGVSCILLVRLIAASPALVRTASATTTDHQGIPSQLIAYVASISTNPESSHCISGTVTPFSIVSATCRLTSTDIFPQTTHYTDCGVLCKVGGETDYSSDYAVYSGWFTAPSNPTVSSGYCASGCSSTAALSEWVGLEDS